MIRRHLNIIWCIACVLTAIGSAVLSTYYPMGWAPSYGPALEPCNESSQGECIATVDLSKTI